MIKTVLTITIVVLSGLVLKVERIEWHQLAEVHYDYFYDEDYGYEVPVAKFSDAIKAIEGKIVEIEGYAYIAEIEGDEEIIILSKNPSSTCFFCGGAGPESVIDLLPERPFKKGKVKMDDRILVRGKFRLNADDYDHLNYILDDAQIID